MHKQQGWLQAWEYCQAKLIQTLGRASQGVNWSWSQCIKSHHAQTSSGKGLPSHFWTRDNVRRSYLGCGEKELDCCSVVQSPLFRWKYILHFIWKSRSQSLEEEWRGTESMLLEVQCEVSQFELNYWNKWTFPRHSNLLRCICICKSTHIQYIFWKYIYIYIYIYISFVNIKN